MFNTARTSSMRVVAAKIKAARQQIKAFKTKTTVKIGGAKNKFPTARQSTGITTGTHNRSGILILIRAAAGKKAKKHVSLKASEGKPVTVITYVTVIASFEKGEIKPTMPFFYKRF